MCNVGAHARVDGDQRSPLPPPENHARLTGVQRPRVVIVGAGFAGLNAAKALARVPVQITIIDRRNFHLFQPLLYQVASAGLNPSDIAYPIRTIFRRQRNVERILLDEVTSVHLAEQSVRTSHGHTIEYDYLIIATGATHSYFGNEEWEAIAPGLKTIEDALLIRRRILASFEHAERVPDEAEKLLTFVIVGAGPTGVELAGAVIEIAVHSMSREFDVIDPEAARVIVVEGADHVLPAYSEKLSAKARRQLETLGVEVVTGSMVMDISDEGVTLGDGTRIPAGTVLWAAGVRGSSLAQTLGLELDRAGRVPVQPDLSLPEHSEVFVTGDLAAIEGVPGVAPAAIQQGKHAAAMIDADMAKRPRTPFRYRDKGSVATIGRARGVADIGPFEFSGFTAWAAWLGIHLFFLIGFRNRLFVLLSWAWNYLTFRRGARIITAVARQPQ